MDIPIASFFVYEDIQKIPSPQERFGTRNSGRAVQIIDSRRAGWDGNMLVTRCYQEGFAPPSDPAGSTQSAPAARANLGNRGVRRNTRGVPVVTVVLITVDGRNLATIWDNLPINWCRISSINSFVKKSVIIAKTTKNSPQKQTF